MEEFNEQNNKVCQIRDIEAPREAQSEESESTFKGRLGSLALGPCLAGICGIRIHFYNFSYITKAIYVIKEIDKTDSLRIAKVLLNW